MNYLSLGLSILIALAAGAVGGLATYSEIPTWYAGLAMPSIAPPNWVFGPVWTTLYILMGIAAWLVWKAQVYAEGERRAKRAALGAYALQLVLNTLWSFMFFGLHALGLAFAELVALWFSIAACIYLFSRFSRTASILLLPYIAWVSFAGLLNYLFWLMN